MSDDPLWPTKKCPGCGETIRPQPNGTRRAFCSRACGREHLRTDFQQALLNLAVRRPEFWQSDEEDRWFRDDSVGVPVNEIRQAAIKGGFTL